MINFINSFMWTIAGIILDRIYEHIILPKFNKLMKRHDLKKMSKLYYGQKTKEYLKKIYSDKLYNCKIGNISIIIPFLSNDIWSNLNIDILSNPHILMYINTDKCKYPIHNRKIKSKIKKGKKLFNNPSLFLHRIICNNDNVCFEVGEYDYYQRISYVNDFEKETYNCVYRCFKPKLRKRYLPNIDNISIASENTIPIGCDAVLAIKIDNDYKICVHERSSETVNYPCGYMVVPSFGFGSIKNVKENPLLYSFFKEYCEEIFNKEEMAMEDNHASPYWFYNQYDEIKDILELINKDRFYLHLIGCGFDAIGSFFNLTLLAIIDDKQVSQKIYNNCKGNWETANHNIKFVSISDDINTIIENGKMSPSSLYSISRAYKILYDKNIK